MHDPTFECDQLDQADPDADWQDEIPTDGAPAPATGAERRAADVFDRVFAETGDMFAAWDAMEKALNGRGWIDVAEEALDACAEGELPVAQAGTIAATALERADAALPLETPGGSRMWKKR